MESRNNNSNNPTLQGRKIRRCLRRRRNVRLSTIQQTQATPTGSTATTATDLHACPISNSVVTSSDPIIDPRNPNAQTTTTIEAKTNQLDVFAELNYSQSEEGEAGTGAGHQEPVLEPPQPPSLMVRNPTTIQAARILFRECQPTQHPHPTRQQLISSPTAGASIVNANRRLIERQIEAIQEADSRRWNFDFGSGIPIAQPSHRYVNYTQTPLRNCRPLIDQNQSSPNRFEQSHQQQHCKNGDYQKRSDHKQDDV